MPSSTGTPLLNATRTLPTAMRLVAMSATMGGPPVTGRPRQIGFVPSRPSRPPVGATLASTPATSTTKNEASPWRAACSAHAPMRPIWWVLRNASTAAPAVFAFAHSRSVAAAMIVWP